MSKRKNNILMTIILLIFVGQASASSVISCPMMVQDTSQTSHQMMNGMDHSSHSMDEMNISESQSMALMQDCCSDNSNCLMSGCATIALSNEFLLLSLEFVSHSIISEYVMAPRQSLSSLYRPPIIS